MRPSFNPHADPTAYRVKVVPDAEPNAEGRWVTGTLGSPLPERACWHHATNRLRHLVPAGHHMVQYEEAGR